MKPVTHHIAFGPVPSRRLGQSLGVNNVTAKACSYTCVYCQVGPTTEKIVEPRAFFSPEDVRAAVAAHLEKVRAGGQRVDSSCLSHLLAASVRRQWHGGTTLWSTS